MFVLGGFMVSSSAERLYGYVTTGSIRHSPSFRIPLDLAGSDAAFFYSLFGLVGAFVLVAGVRGQLSK